MPAAPWAASLLLTLLRWLHALAAIGFLGSGYVYLFGPPGAAVSDERSRHFKEVTDVSFLTFLATGIVLAFERLSHNPGDLYAVVLGLHVVLAIAAFQMAVRWRRGGLQIQGASGRLVMVLGSLTVLLAVVLKGVFESGLRSEP